MPSRSHNTRPTVLVLMGGPDAEREVSINSGRAIAAALRNTDRFNVVDRIIDAPAADELAAMPGDVIFPALHGQWGEGGPLQQTLEQIGRPYVGSGPDASALMMDKLATKRAVESVAVVTPLACELNEGDSCAIEPPIVLKPVDDGSSVDLRICHTASDVDRARAELHPKRGRLMAETYITGRELTVAMLEGEPLPIIEIVPADGLYDYDAKYNRDDTEYRIDPDINPAIAQTMIEWSRRAYDRLDCRDLARMDFMLDETGPNRGLWFLEANTMPGFTDHSLVPMAAAKRGLDMPALCARLVDAALNRATSSNAPHVLSTSTKA